MQEVIKMLGRPPPTKNDENVVCYPRNRVSCQEEQAGLGHGWPQWLLVFRIRSPSSRFLRFLACMMRARSITRTVVGDLDGAAAEISTICHWTRRMEVVWAAV